MNRKFILTGIFLSVFICLSGQQQHAVAAQSLILGVHPYKSASKLQKAYKPLAAYLSSVLSIPVSVSISPDYSVHVDRIGRNKIDIAYMGPASYVQLVEKFGPKPILVRQLIHGKPTFQGKIIVRKDSSLSTLKDLQGKLFAFGDPKSTMSHLVPHYMILNAGVKLKGSKFLGSHDNVALAVLAGDYDAGAVKEAVFYKYEEKGLKVLKTTPALSEHLFVAGTHLKKPQVKKIRNAFLALYKRKDGAMIMQSIKPGITAYGTASNKDYNNLRHILKALKKHNL